MITDIEAYFAKGCGRCSRFATADCSTRLWYGGLVRLRHFCLDIGLEETVRWGHPCYRHADRNIAVIGAFRDDFRISFFNAALLTDPNQVLEKAGPNTQYAGTIRFVDEDSVAAMQETLQSYLIEAMGYAEKGVKPPRRTAEVELPVELEEALNADPELAEAFQRLTPGRQCSYAIHINSAKKPETRFARIERARSRILSGKGHNER